MSDYYDPTVELFSVFFVNYLFIRLEMRETEEVLLL